MARYLLITGLSFVNSNASASRLSRAACTTRLASISSLDENETENPLSLPFSDLAGIRVRDLSVDRENGEPKSL
ncbi:hypothetical protein F5879DRAFT_956083 [Lentinula edodes]|nr:hypothetical protein F5879DRAFT_956083 [Lentinula edodes]